MTTKHLTADELRGDLAAITGIALVAMARGCEIHLSADRTGGACLYRNPAGEDLPVEVHRAVCIAGPIAELALRLGGPGGLTAELLLEQFQMVGVEVPDYAAGYTLADIEFALRILTKSWLLVIEQVEMREHQILNSGMKPH